MNTSTLEFTELKSRLPGLELPKIKPIKPIDGKKEAYVLTNGDLRESANRSCWAVQKDYEEKLNKVLRERYDIRPIRAHAYDQERRHGFIGSQRQGSDVFEEIDPGSPVIVLLTAWQYSHHIAPSLVHHRGPILILANFDGTWPGLVGALNLAGTLTSLGVPYARLWSEKFDDSFFFTKLDEWVKTGKITHDLSYLKEIKSDTDLFTTPAGKLGKYMGEYVLKHKEIMGIFDMFCMGMINGVFPQQSLARIGIPVEGLSQSTLFYEMSKVPQKLKEECLQYYIDKGMSFKFGANEATELTRNQVLEQCSMMIAMARLAERFGCTSIGVQYQQGLKDLVPASDFAEGAIGSSDRFPIPGEDGKIIRPGKPIPCINEVDMGTGIPQTQLFRLLDSMGLPSETTLHDVRWGSEYKGTFYWDFEISGNVPFEHIKGGIAGATGYRQPAMYFSKGGSTIGGQCKEGSFIWARAHYEGLDVHMHIGTGKAFELPREEMQRRLDATTPEWPLMNVTLDGMGRDDLMAGHESNHITVAYVPEKHLADVTRAYVCMCLTQGMKVHLGGKPVI